MTSCILLCEALVILVATIQLLSSGVSEGRSISRAEYQQMKEHLKFLNRPAVKSIKTAYGDIFDCVDIHKQPALDHPLLKNHTIQMRPSSYPKGLKINDPSSTETLNIALENGGCPLGMVPIRRTEMKEILRATSLSKFGRKVDLRLHHHARAEIKPSRQRYYGTQATLNVWNPRLGSWIKFSLSQMWLVAGPAAKEVIEAGWTVNPLLFGDYQSRMFIYWTADTYNRTGCYNLKCPGFVQVNKEIALGMAISPLSVYNGSQYDITLGIFQDKKTNDWWLTWGPNSKLLGYWPKKLFNFLSHSAAHVAWGGEVNGEQPLPQMGSGHFPSEGLGKACYIKHVKVVDASQQQRDVDLIHQCTYTQIEPNCFQAHPAGQLPPGETYFLFGGPGGNCL